MNARPGEFELIHRFLAPLASKEPGALGLSDDGAVLGMEDGDDLVVSTDSLISGVHFLPDDPAPLIAAKLLRVSLSDLASMGAMPWAYTLNLALPEDWDVAWMEGFAGGLETDQALFGINLIGGDTVATNGPLSFSLTAMGKVEKGRALRRSGARQGDGIWVSGTIGDGFLGLLARKGGLKELPADDREFLISRFQVPRPRLDLGRRLTGLANSAIDLSDGLVSDLGHLCEASGLGAEAEGGLIPLSPAARRALDMGLAGLEGLITGGDDFELLFSVPPKEEAELAAWSLTDQSGSLSICKIGTIKAGPGVRVLDGEGAALDLTDTGYRHF